MPVPNRVKETRLSLALTPTKVATLADISTKTLSRIEHGEPGIKQESKQAVFLVLQAKKPQLTYEYLFPDAGQISSHNRKGGNT